MKGLGVCGRKRNRDLIEGIKKDYLKVTGISFACIALFGGGGVIRFDRNSVYYLALPSLYTLPTSTTRTMTKPPLLPR